MLIFISILLIIVSALFIYQVIKKNKQFTIKRNLQQEQYNRELTLKTVQLLKEQESITKQTEQIKILNAQKIKEQELKAQQEIDEYIKNQQSWADEVCSQIIAQKQQEIDAYDREIDKQEQTLKDLCDQIIKEREEHKKELENLKSALTAGTEAQLRARQQKEKLNFYKLSVSQEDLADIIKLEKIKLELRKPVILSKLIWTQFFQKQMTELCERILGKKQICGIYKITNLESGQCYIGQSINIADRWKQHCKCGLGIDASATNALYNAMQKDGVWNFTFELLEECSKEQLNEKERFWIDMFQSNRIGLNTMKGIVKQ